MKSVFLGTQKKYLKNATDKYNIPFRELSPFMTKVKQDKNHMVNEILNQEKTKRDQIAKRALNKSPFEREKFRIK